MHEVVAFMNHDFKTFERTSSRISNSVTAKCHFYFGEKLPNVTLNVNIFPKVDINYPKRHT